MPSRQDQLRLWLAHHGPGPVTPADFQALLAHLAPISESGLHRLLRASGAPLHPLAAGVDQSSLPALRASLLALAAVYESAPDRLAARRIVITAKDHARLAARNQRVSPAKRAEKEEMANWLLTWLENPAVFPLWAALRSKALGVD